MTAETPVYGVGTLVYVDIMSGRLKGKITRIVRDPVTRSLKFDVKVTAKHPTYDRGGVLLDWSACNVVPRKHWRKSRKGPFNYYVTPFAWAVTEDAK